MNNDIRPQNGEPKQHWCKNHLFSLWLEPYPQCVQGRRLNEKCIRGDKDESEVKDNDK